MRRDMKKILLLIPMTVFLLITSCVNRISQLEGTATSTLVQEGNQSINAPEITRPIGKTETPFDSSMNPPKQDHMVYLDEWFSDQNGAGIITSSPAESKGQVLQTLFPGRELEKSLFHTEADVYGIIPSPNGKSILVKSIDSKQPVGKGDSLEINVIQESTLLPVITQVWLRSEVWSRDSSKFAVVYSPGESIFRLAIFSSNGEEINNIPFNEYANYHLVGWSENDSELILLRQVGGGFFNDKIIVLNYETLEFREIFQMDYMNEKKSIGPVYISNNGKTLFGLMYPSTMEKRDLRDLFMIDIETKKIDYLIKQGDEGSLIVSNLYINQAETSIFFLSTREPRSKGGSLYDFILFKLDITGKKTTPIMNIASNSLSLLGWQNENSLFYSETKPYGSLTIGSISLIEKKRLELLQLNQSGFMSLITTWNDE